MPNFPTPPIAVPTQRPTVGRIVHLSYQGKRTPAVVLAVQDLETVDLAPLDRTGNLLNVKLFAESEESSKLVNQMLTPHQTWAWPPR